MKDKNNNYIVLIILGIVFVVFIFFRNSIKTSEITPGKIASIPDPYYKAMLMSGGIGKNLDGISFSQDGKKVIFSVKETSSATIYINNTKGPAYDSVTLSPSAFSKNGQHYFYSATKGNNTFIVVDNTEGEYYKNANIQEMFLNDSGAAAYKVTSYGDETNVNLSEKIVFNGFSGKTYRIIEFLRMSPDEKEVVYYGCKPDYKNSTMYDNALWQGSGVCELITQDVGGSIHEGGGIFYFNGINEATYLGDIAYSPDGSLMAYTTYMGNESSLSINGVQTFSPPGNYERKIISDVIFSRDSKHIAYIVRGCGQKDLCKMDKFGETNGGTSYVVMDNNSVGANYDNISSLTFDMQGQPAYLALLDSYWFLIDGEMKTRVTCGSPNNLHFGLKNSYFYSCINQDGGVAYVYNGKSVQAPSGDIAELPDLTPSGDLILLVEASSTKNMSLYVNGILKIQHDMILPLLAIPISTYDSLYQYTNSGGIIYGAVDGQDISVLVDILN